MFLLQLWSCCWHRIPTPPGSTQIALKSIQDNKVLHNGQLTSHPACQAAAVHSPEVACAQASPLRRASCKPVHAAWLHLAVATCPAASCGGPAGSLCCCTEVGPGCLGMHHGRLCTVHTAAAPGAAAARVERSTVECYQMNAAAVTCCI
jgi:hypothetical protein